MYMAFYFHQDTHILYIVHFYSILFYLLVWLEYIQLFFHLEVEKEQSITLFHWVWHTSKKKQCTCVDVYQQIHGYTQSWSFSGLIIDSFGELRDQQEQVKEDMEVRFETQTLWIAPQTLQKYRLSTNELFCVYSFLREKQTWAQIKTISSHVHQSNPFFTKHISTKHYETKMDFFIQKNLKKITVCGLSSPQQYTVLFQEL